MNWAEILITKNLIERRKKKEEKKKYGNCNYCHFQIIINGRPICRIGQPWINQETGICEDWKEKNF